MGDRFSHSIDIGKALEEEAERQKRIEEAEKQAAEPTKEEISEEPVEIEPEEEAPEEPPGPPDPLEEDIKEIINKDIPVLRPRKTVPDQFKAFHVPLFLILIIIAGFWSLTLNDDLPLIDIRAEQAVKKQLQVGIASKIDAEWEFLSQQEKARKASRLYVEASKTPEVESEISELTQRLKGYYQSPGGIPYFFGIAPYKLSRLSQNIIESGHAGETLRNGFSWDTLNMAPEGVAVENRALPAFYATVFKISRVFSSVNLERTLFLSPVILGILSAIVLFFIVRLLFGSFPALAASIVFAGHPLLLRASGSGHPGAQPVVLLLFLIVVLLAAWIMKARGFLRILSIILILPFSWWAIKIWSLPLIPDSSLSLIIRALGGLLIVLFALISALVLAWKTFKLKEGTKIFTMIWLTLSLIVMIWKPQLLVLTLPAFCAVIGWGTNGIARELQRVFDWFVETPGHIVVRSLACIVIMFFVIGTFWSAVKAESRVLPVMHDAIMKTGEQISLKSDESAIINTGWDLSALWQFASNRATILDQETIDASRLWKLSRVFVTSDESEAIDTLRLLDCGGVECPEAFTVVTEDMLLSLPRYEAITLQEVADASPDYDPGRVSAVFSCSRRGTKLSCANEYDVDLASLEAKRNTKNPAALHLYVDGTKKTRAFDSNFNFVLVVFADTDNDYRSFLVHQDLADSMMVRFFANDQNMRHFVPFLVLDTPDRVVTHSIAWKARNITFSNVVSADTPVSELGKVLAQTLKD